MPIKMASSFKPYKILNGRLIARTKKEMIQIAWKIRASRLIFSLKPVSLFRISFILVKFKANLSKSFPNVSNLNGYIVK
ncbi:MAG: hypothetical protein B7X86_12335 [Sphingobacteriales bacterium 17-39-43]|nr:MAG: hypothetical protein B7Y24_12045 [Sphingobacteriales bacterium 16-39-50]OZA23489.1 MAG: hypothetical protein B7X86_12335 [Sphingobacteriales bacterium 17-39-43]